MNHFTQQDRLTSWFWSDDVIRSRCVSGIVLTGTVDIPAPPLRLLADWDREISSRLDLEPGDVEEMPLARARARWPDYKHCVQAVAGWSGTLGLPGLLATSDVALMVCRGARYHHDGEQYGSAVFCNLFVSDDKGLDLHFPSMDLRIPLTRGTVVIFDTCQPHGVIRRHGDGFSPTDFPAEQDFTQLFLTWELPVEDEHVTEALDIVFDTAPSTSPQPEEEQVWLNGAHVTLCPDSGRWIEVD
ncbi:hypothetical protein [Caballeronia sp. dw_276]|jgi:hypothetical protein|uniref:hypothetical protein n=1 Tax=Caballeronia sp. dw_276 TaxID=2719795 RepID=UPI001BD25E2D|nr:hypothetical protein [Caballeronia sp. dw_276]